MTAKTEMMQAHEAMALVLDAKFSSVPEWKAFRAIDRALLALETEQSAAPDAPKERQRITPAAVGDMPSYISLAFQALEEGGGKPITTPKLMEYIGSRRKLNTDRDKAKVSVISSLSKDKRFKSIQWEGGRAWWYADRPPPAVGLSS